MAQGGTTVLTEVPEMFGAETLLMARCKDEKVFRKTVSLINDFKNYFISHGQPVFENPSPGNKAGGFPPWKKSHWDVHRNPERLPCAMCWNMERPCLLRD